MSSKALEPTVTVSKHHFLSGALLLALIAGLLQSALASGLPTVPNDSCTMANKR